MAGLALRTNQDQVFRDLDRFAVAVKDRAAPRILNSLRDAAQLAGLRAVNDEYQIGPRTAEKWLRVKIATREAMQAIVTARGRGFPLEVFKPIQRKDGVSVLVKGRRFTIPHTFLIERFGLHVFARGAYAGKTSRVQLTGRTFGRFQFGRARLPIHELFTFGPAEAWSNPKTIKAMDAAIRDKGRAIAKREIDGVKRGF